LDNNATKIQTTEAYLIDYLEKVAPHRQERKAIIVALSNFIKIEKKDSRFFKISELFKPIAVQLKGQIFFITNGDIVVIYKNMAQSEVNAFIREFISIFSDDANLVEALTQTNHPIFKHFNLNSDFFDLQKLSHEYYHQEVERRRKTLDQDLKLRHEQGKLKTRLPLTGDFLSKVEKVLAYADISSLMIRQSISTISEHGSPNREFFEIFISIESLRDVIAPHINLTSSPWLFQQLTETLDKRILTQITRHDDHSLVSNFSINLNIATLLSNDFLLFNDHIKQEMKKTVVIEIQCLDVFSDISGYIFVRKFIKELGYKICIDGIKTEHLPFIDNKKIQADYLKIIWSPDLKYKKIMDDMDFMSYVRINGFDRFILCRCDTQDAIEYGQSIGLEFFQGRYVESLYRTK
jgi:hypothetical protein